MLKTFTVAATMALACALGIGGPAQAQSVLRLGDSISAEPPSLDTTANIAAAIASILLYNTMETLVQIDDDGRLQPLLAESWEQSEDGLTYTFKIREGVRFHDNNPLTAEDVVFTLTYGRDHPGHAQKFAFMGVDTVEATGPYTVAVKLKAPDSTFLVTMAKRAGIIISQRNLADMGSHPIGTGPLEFEAWHRGESLIFDRFEGYWGNPAQVDRVEWRFIPDANALLNALLAGDIDAARRVDAKSRLPEVQNNDRFVIKPGVTSSVHLLSVNHRAAPFDNPRVRQALALAIDNQAIIDGMNDGFGVKTSVFASPVDAYFDPGYDPYPYDPARARRILTEERALGANVTITSISNNASARQAEIVLAQLFAAGFNARVESFDLATGLDMIITKRTYQVAPVGVISERLVSNLTCAVLWYQNYCNPAFDALIKGGREATTPEESTRLFREASHLAADDVVVIPFYVDENIAAHASYVSGWRPFHPDGVVDLRSVRVDR